MREPVSSQTPEERDQATQRALETLVLRLTGDPKAAQSPGLAALRKDPQQIISQYGFDAGPPEVLKVDFDPAATGQALRRAGLFLMQNLPRACECFASARSQPCSFIFMRSVPAALVVRNLFMRFLKFLFVGCLSMVSLSSHAETVKGLYQVREPVSSQTPEERDQATQRALDTLVLRLTGDPKAAQKPGSGGACAKTLSKSSVSSAYEAGPPQVLKVDFDPATTEQALRRAGLAMWGANRPSILGWWLNDSTEGSSLVGDGQASATPLRRAAQHRGLPLRLPLADLNEQIVATAPNLESADPAPLRGASRPLQCRRLAGGACP